MISGLPNPNGVIHPAAKPERSVTVGCQTRTELLSANRNGVISGLPNPNGVILSAAKPKVRDLVCSQTGGSCTGKPERSDFDNCQTQTEGLGRLPNRNGVTSTTAKPEMIDPDDRQTRNDSSGCQTRNNDSVGCQTQNDDSFCGQTRNNDSVGEFELSDPVRPPNRK